MTSLSTYDFSTLYTTLPHNLIKEKLLDLIERAFKTFYKIEGTLDLACNDKKAFFTPTDHRGYTLLLSVFGVRVSVTFYLTCAHIISSPEPKAHKASL